MKRIYARNCEVKEITNKEANDFFSLYHRQGTLASSVAFGLFYNGELVQAESFGVPRIEIQSKYIWHDWELYRECSHKDYYIIGGKSKLLKAFVNKYKPLSLLSYCNTTLGFDGHSYAACGFKLERTSDDYYYEYNGEIIKRYRMQKNVNLRKQGKVEPIQRTLESFGKTYDPNKTEKENAEIAGFKRINGTGQQVWTKYYSDNIGYIYEITNTENGKTYIGQHTLLKNGKLGKINYFGSGVHLTRAIKKYGKNAFKIKVLEWTADLTKLTDLEYKYILEAKANGKAEYNVSTSPFNASSHNYQNATPSNSKTMIEYYKTHDAPQKGKKASIETKIKMSEAARNKPKPWIAEKVLPKVRESYGYKHRDLSNKNHDYGDEWKKKVSEQTKIKMAEQKARDNEYIHSMGYVTVEDLMTMGWKDKQIRKLTPVGILNRRKYFVKPE